MRIKRFLSLLFALLALIVCSGQASAEAFALSGWESKPVEAVLSLQEETHMPLDAERTEELNRLLAHIELRMRREAAADAEWQELAIRVDGIDAAVLTVRADASGSALAIATEEGTLAFRSAAPDILSRVLGLGSAAAENWDAWLQAGRLSAQDGTVTGTLTWQTEEAGTAWGYTFSPALALGENGAALAGDVAFSQTKNGSIWRTGRITLQAACEAPFDWHLPEDTVSIDAIEGEALQAVQDQVMYAVARPLIRRLVLLWPATENVYLNRDLDDWQSIVREAVRPSDWEE